MDVHAYFKGLSSGIPEGVQRKMDVHTYSGETTQELQRNMSVSSASVARPHRDLWSPNGQYPRQASLAPYTVTQDYRAKPVRLGLHSAFGFPHRDRRSPNESTTNPPFIEDDGGSRSNPGLPVGTQEALTFVPTRPSWSTVREGVPYHE